MIENCKKDNEKTQNQVSNILLNNHIFLLNIGLFLVRENSSNKHHLIFFSIDHLHHLNNKSIKKVDVDNLECFR